MPEPLFSCQFPDCATEISYHADMLKTWKREPVCEECHSLNKSGEDPIWDDLPSFIPDHEKRIADLDAENARLREALDFHALADLRAYGWTVAVHNDYRVGGEVFTFWLFTKDDRCVKGEGRTDQEALDQVRRAALALEKTND